MGGFEDRGERKIGRAAFTQVQTFKPEHEELPFQQRLVESRAWLKLLNQSVQHTKQRLWVHRQEGLGVTERKNVTNDVHPRPLP